MLLNWNLIRRTENKGKNLLIQGTGSFTRAYYSIDSISANRSLAETADETIAIDYLEHTEPPDFVGYGPSHGWVQTTYLDLLTEQALFDDILNIRDLEENSIFQKNWDNGNEALLVTQKNDDGITPGHIEFLEFEKAQILRPGGESDTTIGRYYYGTRLDNTIQPSLSYLNEHEIYTGSGSDSIKTFDEGFTITDLNLNDFSVDEDSAILLNNLGGLGIENIHESIIIYTTGISGRTNIIAFNNLSQEERGKIIEAFNDYKENKDQEIFVTN